MGQACLDRLLVAVTGLPGSGKSLVSKVIAGELGATIYSMGDIVRREVARRGLEMTVANVERVASELRAIYGRSAVADLLVNEIRGSKGPIVVDGLRSLDEAESFRRAGWNVVIVAVFAPRKLRAERLKLRGRIGESSEEDLALRDEANIGFGVAEAMALADYMIVNDGSIEEVERSAAIVAREIMSGACKSDS